MTTFEDFQKLDVRVGKIIEALDFPEARKPSFKLKIDFGPEIGIKKSIGGFAKNYSKEEILNKLVLCVVNFPPRQVGKAISEVLTLGVATENSSILLTPDKDVPLGSKMN